MKKKKLKKRIKELELIIAELSKNDDDYFKESWAIYNAYVSGHISYETYNALNAARSTMPEPKCPPGIIRRG